MAKTTVKKSRSAGLAGVFSFLIPGLGQVYNGEFGKAVGFILGAIITGSMIPTMVGPVLFVVLWIWAILDAYQSADAVNGTPRDEEAAA